MGYRLGIYHPGVDIQIGTGNTHADIVVVQPHTKMPNRDAITGALKNFGMLGDAYRATTNIVGVDDQEVNRYYLAELISIIRPLVVVACGPEVMSYFKQRHIKANAFIKHAGKRFQVPDLTHCVFYAVTNPTDYGFARASEALKARGKHEWTELATLYRKLKEKKEKARWAC
ncbi:MAG: hypothetical protein ACXABY_03950 [Candidatus Thorarchaeota archaeon]